MKIAVLNQFALPRSEAGGTRHVDVFNQLSGYEVVIISGNRHHQDQREFVSSDPLLRTVRIPSSDGSPRSRLFSWLAYDLLAGFSVLRLGRQDVIYASSPQLTVPLVGLVLARITGASLVVEVRDLWPESFVAAGLLTDGSIGHKIFQVMERLAVRWADEVVAVTHGWEDHFERLGVAPSRYHVIPNGTDIAALSPNRSRSVVRRELGVEGTVAVFAGSHGPKDGLDEILDAAVSLPDVTFLLIGSGRAKTAALETSRSLQLRNVIFHEPVAKSELGDYLAAADIGVHAVTPLPVFDKGMSPNKLFDYLAAGLPVVSNASVGVGKIFGAKDCGVLGGPGDLAGCIREVIAASGETKRRWGSNAEELMRTTYSRFAASNRLAEVLVSSRSRRR